VDNDALFFLQTTMGPLLTELGLLQRFEAPESNYTLTAAFPVARGLKLVDSLLS